MKINFSTINTYFGNNRFYGCKSDSSNPSSCEGCSSYDESKFKPYLPKTRGQQAQHIQYVVNFLLREDSEDSFNNSDVDELDKFTY